MKKKVGIFRLSFAISSGIAAVLQTVAMLIHYEGSTNYFHAGAILPTLAVMFALLGAGCGTVAACMTDVSKLNDSPFRKGRSSSATSAIGFLEVAVFLPLYSGYTANPTVAVLAAVFSVIAVVYCILSCMPTMREKRPNLLVFLGFAVILANILAIAYYYFDMSVEMNASIKVVTQMGLLCAMLYYTGEIRYLLGKPTPRMFLTLASWTISIGSLSALSVPIAYFVGKVERSDYAAGAILVFCILLTVLIRYDTLLKAPIAKSEDEPNRKDPT